MSNIYSEVNGAIVPEDIADQLLDLTDLDNIPSPSNIVNPGALPAKNLDSSAIFGEIDDGNAGSSTTEVLGDSTLDVVGIDLEDIGAQDIEASSASPDSEQCDEVDWQTLVSANTPLVYYQVNGVVSRLPAHINREDLLSAGFEALVLAAQSYDSRQLVPFGRYAAIRIRGAIIDELRSGDWMSRASRRNMRDMEEFTVRFVADFGRAPSRQEIASAMGTSVDKVDATKVSTQMRNISLDEPTLEFGKEVAAPGKTPEEEALLTEDVQHLHIALACLPRRLGVVIERTYLSGRTVMEVAEELNLTQSRISQLRAEGLMRLRYGMEAANDPQAAVQLISKRAIGKRRAKYMAKVVAVVQGKAEPGPIDED